jgi:hypothetical protein
MLLISPTLQVSISIFAKKQNKKQKNNNNKISITYLA